MRLEVSGRLSREAFGDKNVLSTNISYEFITAKVTLIDKKVLRFTGKKIINHPAKR